MSTMPVREAILRELDELSEARQAEVLAFLRYLRIGVADRADVDRGFAEALAVIRRTASERSLTERDVEGEVEAARSGR